MSIIILLICVLALYKFKFTKNGISDDYISIINTKKINGIFVLLVFLSHSMQYVNYSESWYDSYGIIILNKIGQLMVTTFLFFSGYGIYESIKKKGNSYIDNIPKNRIGNTLLKFDTAVIIFCVVYYLIGVNYPIRKILLSLIGWESVGNSNWYIFTILVLYTITYITFKLVKNNDFTRLCVITVLTIIYIGVIRIYKESYWYNTSLCYCFGMWYGLYKNIIEKKLCNNKNYYITLFTLLIGFILSYLFKSREYIYCTSLVFTFLGIIVLLSMKLTINSKVLEFFGKNVFYIYVYQRIPMVVLKKLNLFSNNKYIFIICSLGITVLITIFFNRINELKKNNKYKIKK